MISIPFLLESKAMSATELLDELKHLSNADRLAVIEAATRLIRQDLSVPASGREVQERRLAAAALDARGQYEPGGDLTEWTSLDAEDFADANLPG